MKFSRRIVTGNARKLTTTALEENEKFSDYFYFKVFLTGRPAGAQPCDSRGRVSRYARAKPNGVRGTEKKKKRTRGARTSRRCLLAPYNRLRPRYLGYVEENKKFTHNINNTRTAVAQCPAAEPAEPVQVRPVQSSSPRARVIHTHTHEPPVYSGGDTLRNE